MHAYLSTRKTQSVRGSIFAPHELASMQSAIDAVCNELGVSPDEQMRRSAIAERIMSAYKRGGRQPLNLVHAGLNETMYHIGR